MSTSSNSTSSTTTAAVITEFGNPEEVLKLREDWPLAAPAEGELRLRIVASPINPADINLIQGNYGVKPPLPAVGGIEGYAEVVEVGPGVSGFVWGDKVLLPQGAGCWRAELIAKAEEVVPLPADVVLRLDPLQAAMLSVNPPTAWRMLHDFADLKPGDWVVQNAANSGVGLAVAALARTQGWRTVNLARSPEALERVRDVGGDALVLDDDNAAAAIREATGGEPIRLALNAVGGESAARMAKCLAPDSTLVTYGAMSRQPVKVSNALLIFQNIRYTGFWVSKWRKEHTREQWRAMIADLAKLMAEGRLRSGIAAVYPLEHIHQALAHAQQPSRNGKVLITPGRDPNAR